MHHNFNYGNQHEMPHDEPTNQEKHSWATEWFVGRFGQRFGFEMPADLHGGHEPLADEERLQEEQGQFRRWQDQEAHREHTFRIDEPVSLVEPEVSSFQEEIDTRVAALRAEGLSDSKIKARLSRSYHPDVNPRADPEAMRYLNSRLAERNDQ
jgi:hypothetical protein